MNQNNTKALKKFLSFKLEAEEYGLDILRVREILGKQSITAVPGTPVWLSGVINLRGRIIPVMDLRKRFQLPPSPEGAACIITVELKREGAEVLVGLLVDAVSEVLQVGDDDIEAMPGLSGSKGPEEVMGLAKGQGKVRILLDVDKVVGEGSADLEALKAAREKAEESREPVAS